MLLMLMNDDNGDAHVYDADVDDGVDHVTGDAVDDPPTMISMMTMMLMTREGWARGRGPGEPEGQSQVKTFPRLIQRGEGSTCDWPAAVSNGLALINPARHAARQCNVLGSAQSLFMLATLAESITCLRSRIPGVHLCWQRGRSPLRVRGVHSRSPFPS